MNNLDIPFADRQRIVKEVILGVDPKSPDTVRMAQYRERIQNEYKQSKAIPGAMPSPITEWE